MNGVDHLPSAWSLGSLATVMCTIERVPVANTRPGEGTIGSAFGQPIGAHASARLGPGPPTAVNDRSAGAADPYRVESRACRVRTLGDAALPW